MRWCTVLCLTIALPGVARAQSVPELSVLFFRVGPAERVLGPTAGMADQRFFALRSDGPNAAYGNLRTARAGGAVRGYTANGSSFLLEGPTVPRLSLWPTGAAPLAVIERGTNGLFDECGAWLIGAFRDGPRIHAWYHAEASCNYAIGQSHHSVAYAFSDDGGFSFVKPEYPANRVLFSAQSPQSGRQTGVGAGSLVPWRGYHHLYYRDNQGWRTKVARSALADGGRPGTWRVWDGSGFVQPGRGGAGEGAPLGAYYLGTGASHFAPTDRLVLVSMTASLSFGGPVLHFSPDGIVWERFAEPLMVVLESNWSRGPEEGELVGYTSIVAPRGGKSWIDAFHFFYTYLQPGETFQQKYLVRRRVNVGVLASPGEPQVEVALTRYHDAAGADHWATTAMVPPPYVAQKTLGYLFTAARPGMVALYGCYDPATNDHTVRTENEPRPGELRQLGWLWVTARPGTVPLYRCWNPATTDHVLTTTPDCEGAGQSPVLLGHLSAG